MGNSLSKHFDPERGVDLGPGDLAFLIMGCAGTKTGEFAEMAMGRQLSPVQKPKIRLLREINVPGLHQPVVLILLPGTEKRHAKDNQDISRVQKWLGKSRPEDPYVDHIFLFPEDPLGVRPAQLASYLGDLAKLCCRTNDGDVHEKISLILEDASGATVQDNGYWVEKGVERHHFEHTEESARRILRQVAP